MRLRGRQDDAGCCCCKWATLECGGKRAVREVMECLEDRLIWGGDSTGWWLDVVVAGVDPEPEAMRRISPEDCDRWSLSVEAWLLQGEAVVVDDFKSSSAGLKKTEGGCCGSSAGAS
jgi:hypothetical protein